ncbi:MAG: hypothetical protein H7Z40_04290 [Phycisphaerae bacterium]|nr:hypothetical protein [Gemmatimonadaceae bacterium]
MKRSLKVRTLLGGATLVASALLPTTKLSAQSNISSQGLGYPVSGTSTRVSGTAGAFSQFDLITPHNPAALTGLGRAALSVQAEPEYRTLTLNSVKESVNIQRIPLLMVGARLTSRAVLGFSSSTFLDRNYSTTTPGQVLIDGKIVATNDITDMRGSISDIRAGLGWRISPRISVGLAGHVFTGSNKLTLLREFSDTLTLGRVVDSSSVDFFGRAVSVGGEFRLPKGFVASGSYRLGGKLEAENADTISRRGNIPDRISGGLMYSGLAGASFALNVEQTNWSEMQSLGSALLETHDATNISGGAEIATGRLRGTPVLLRVGVARNTLPFGLNGGTVSEMRFAAGAALAITNPGRDQAVLDFSIQRANRKLSGSAAREGAWLLGIGLQIRP